MPHVFTGRSLICASLCGSSVPASKSLTLVVYLREHSRSSECPFPLGRSPLGQAGDPAAGGEQDLSNDHARYNRLKLIGTLNKPARVAAACQGDFRPCL